MEFTVMINHKEVVVVNGIEASYEAYNGDITNYMNAFNDLFSNIISAHDFIMLLEDKKVTKNMTDEMYYQYKKITK